MSTSGPVDVRGHVMHVGDFVCYTTNAEGSSLNYGTIHKINSKQVQRYDRDRNPYYVWTHKIVVDKTDVFRNPRFDTDWDSVKREHVPTDRQLRSGQIDYSPHKFMLVN